MLETYIHECLLWPNDRPTATFKREPVDFQVNEVLEWDFTGQGEHIFLYVEKINCNTAWVAKQLARFYDVPPRDVGYAGLKDRHAITRQYFSIRYPGIKAGEYELPVHDEYRIIDHILHNKKLKRGNHNYNDFIITLHDIDIDRGMLDEHLKFIQKNGCPNFFDTQRFGHNGNNLIQLQQWVAGNIEPRKRDEKSLLLSALRSALFNQQLAERVKNNSWQTILTGDCVMLDGSNSFFIAECVDETIIKRSAEKDIHPAGILVGATDEFNSTENINDNKLRELMRREHLDTGHRPFRLRVKNLTWTYSDNQIVIKMRLPAGAYASSVVKQILKI